MLYNMKRCALSCFLYFLFIGFALAQGEGWQRSSSTHFLVYYKNAPEEFIDKVKQKAEECYDKIAEDLGFRRYDFWLWDDRARIYIYDDAQSYYLATKQSSWSDGCAYPKEKTIHSFVQSKSFFDTVLPHEMGHIVFREFVGFNNPQIPLWLDEGVASYEQSLRASTASLIKEAKASGKFIPFSALSDFSLHEASVPLEQVQLFYAESVNLLEYLVKKFGKESFVEFCRALRDKRDFASSLASVYPYSSPTELGQEWEKYL